MLEDIETLDFELDVAVKEVFPPLENLEVTPTKEEQTFNHERSYGYDEVVVKPIPDEYIIPEGTLPITENTTYDVRDYARVTASVYPAPNLQDKEATPTKEEQIITFDSEFDGLNQVKVNPIPDEYTIPTGTLEITTNGEHNVKDYEKVVTDVHEVSKYKPRYISFYGYNGTELQQEIDALSFENMTETRNMFYGVSSLQSIDFSSIDLSPITSFYNMCYNATALQSINFGTSRPKPTRLENMMYNCSNLTSLDISNFDGSSLTSLVSICYNNKKLTSIILPSNLGENGGYVGFERMLNSCSSLEEIDFSYIHCTVNSIAQMFASCSKLKRVDLRNFVNYFKPSVLNMFNGCTLLEHIDMRSWDFSEYTSNYASMLNSVPTTCEIIVKDEASKTWFSEKFPTYTNVKTAEEYESI